MKLKLAAVSHVLILLGLADPRSAFSQAPAPTPAATSASPDKQWKYVGGDTPKLLNAATNEVTVEFSDSPGGKDSSQPVWAPDSKQFAIPSAGGKGGSATSVYQLHDGKWEAGEALGNGDDIMDRAGKVIDAKAKKKGMPKGTFLHMNSWTVDPQKWLDASTLVVYAAMAEVAHRKDGEYAGLGFGTDLLLTLKFDESGDWKIIKTREMTEKEVKQEHPVAR